MEMWNIWADDNDKDAHSMKNQLRKVLLDRRISNNDDDEKRGR